MEHLNNNQNADYYTANGSNKNESERKTEILATGDLKLIEKWKSIQNDMRSKIVNMDSDSLKDLSNLKLVAGLDISYPVNAHDKSECDAFAAVVICSYPSLEVVHEEVQRVTLDVPYVPGYLAFRESAPLVKLLSKIIHDNPALKPDVLLVDGNGILHPQECGSSCHIGYLMNIPTVGVAKNLYQLDGLDVNKPMVQNMPNLGDYVYLRDRNKTILGMALKTAAKAKNPVYISIGHKICLPTARKIVLTCSRFRIPEPLRFADIQSRELVRRMELLLI